MFQPQPTPFGSFSAAYAVGLSSPPPPLDFPFQNTVVDSGGPIVIPDPLFNSVPPTSTNPLPLPFNHHQGQPYKMADGGPHDMEAQEALAREYQPALEGPLVGEKKSSHAITEEYAKADPIYVAKTIALPETYSHYRPILGDGSCGWRAVAFAYFETLVRLRNKDQLEVEIARMTSLNNLLATAGGFAEMVFEDMVEETLNLLRSLSNVIQDTPEAADIILFQRFNNPECSNQIVYHLRLLATSWLRANPLEYQGFIPDGVIEDYCKNTLEPVNEEIDNVGMQLLIDVLLKPVGISVDIAHLDRSAGAKVNHHYFRASDSVSPEEPMIHLLFRPTHYDILYKDAMPPRQDIPTGNANIQVNRASFAHRNANHRTTSTMNDFSNIDFNSLVGIPGFGIPLPSHGFASSFQPSMDSTCAPAPVSTSMSPISLSGSVLTPQSSTSSLATGFPSQQGPSASLMAPTMMSPHATFPPGNIQIPIHPVPDDGRGFINSPSNPVGSFRPSKYEWEAAADWHEGPTPTFRTSTFKNSHYNTAHYNNPNFQPEEWSPEMEEMGSSHRKKSS